MENFTRILTLQAKEERIFAALTGSIHEWWTKVFEGDAQEPGQTFTIGFGPGIYKTLLVEELVPHNRVTWQVVDALIDLPELENKREWINTRIVWEIFGGSGGSIVKLTHMGLTTEVECYQVCASGWQTFLQSFEKFIMTGVGSPFKPANLQSSRKEPV